MVPGTSSFARQQKRDTQKHYRPAQGMERTFFLSAVTLPALVIFRVSGCCLVAFAVLSWQRSHFVCLACTAAEQQ
jgi:hypothetical protein